MFYQREYCVCFHDITYSSPMPNRWHSNHHNNKNEVEDVVLTRAESHHFCEDRQQSMCEIRQGIATLVARKSYHDKNYQYIQRYTPNYKKISFFDGDMCKLDFIDRLLDLEENFNFGRFLMKKKYSLYLINWTMK